MLPDPLHPAVVHFPLVLAFLLPISALAAAWAIRRGARPARAWTVPLVVALALVGSGWVALETGGDEEERVEAFVSEAVIHEHEEAAERFLVLGGVVALVTVAGLFGGAVGTAGRVLGGLGSLVVLAAAVQVGAAGGDLVYRHGAAEAYVQAAAGDADRVSPPVRSEDEDERRTRGEDR